LLIFEGFSARWGNTSTIIRWRNEAPPENKKEKMKTRILLTTLGVAALAAITFNVNASDALLSPRAAGNQIKAAPATVADRNIVTENQTTAVSPRAFGNQTTSVASVANDVNPALACRNMAGSPKAGQACAEHPATMPGCNLVTVAPLK
jgi:hypothetical protein